jgi:hypothetical protein
VLAVSALLMAALGTFAATSSSAQAVSCPAPTNTTAQICNPAGSGVNLRVHPQASGNAKWLSYGGTVFINCWQTGQNINGPWGTSDIWDFVSWTSAWGYAFQGFVSDTYIYTGTNGPIPGAARCPGGLQGNF